MIFLFLETVWGEAKQNKTKIKPKFPYLKLKQHGQLQCTVNNNATDMLSLKVKAIVANFHDIVFFLNQKYKSSNNSIKCSRECLNSQYMDTN